jgi:hypothetical protein
MLLDTRKEISETRGGMIHIKLGQDTLQTSNRSSMTPTPYIDRDV